MNATKNRQGEIRTFIAQHITSIKYEHTGRNVTIFKFALPIISKLHFITQTITPSLHDIIALVQR